MITIPFGKSLAQSLYNSMEGECIRDLLSQHDTFTSDAYEDRVDNWIALAGGFTREDLGMERRSLACIRRQILATAMVVEVASNVWAKRP